MGKYLDYYNKCCELGELPNYEDHMQSNGLCYSVVEGELLDLFYPTLEDVDELVSQKLTIGWWASGVLRREILITLSKVYSALYDRILYYLWLL